MARHFDRETTAFDLQRRIDHKSLMIFSGFATAAGGSLSLTSIQTMLTDRFPVLRETFPAYDQYLTLSGWLAFIAGVFFLIYPVAISVWIARALVLMSLLFLIAASYGIAAYSLMAFVAAYWLMLIVGLGTQGQVLPFSLRHTRYDGPIVILLMVLQAGWAGYEFTKLL